MIPRIKLINLEDKNNNIKTQEELKTQLLKYKSILNKPTYDYLSALIGLDISVLGDYISEESKQSLSELNIYSDIARYSIFSRTIKLMRQEEANIGPISISDRNEILTIKSNNIILFEYNHVNSLFGKTYIGNSKDIGSISIYKTLLASSLDNETITLVKEKLKQLEERINPYGSYNNSFTNQRLSYTWEKERKQEIVEYKHFLNSIKKEKKLDSIEDKEIEVSTYTYDILNKEFNIKEAFDAVEVDLENQDHRGTCVKSLDSLVLNKTLTKRTSNLIIVDKIKYI